MKLSKGNSRFWICSCMKYSTKSCSSTPSNLKQHLSHACKWEKHSAVFLWGGVSYSTWITVPCAALSLYGLHSSSGDHASPAPKKTLFAFVILRVNNFYIQNGLLWSMNMTFLTLFSISFVEFIHVCVCILNR